MSMNVFSNHDEYKKHLSKLFKIKGTVDHSQPSSQKFTHLRPNTFKEDLHKQREVRMQNDQLVVKILKQRGLTQG